MRAYHCILLTVALCMLPALAFAQAPQNPTVGVNYWKCDFAKMGELTQIVDSLYKPVAQELVDEGTILAFGMLTHQWGDDWNVVFYMTTPDTPGYLAAFAEVNSRFDERHPDALPITDYCSEHKDNIYTLQTVTEPAPQTGSH